MRAVITLITSTTGTNTPETVSASREIAGGLAAAPEILATARGAVGELGTSLAQTGTELATVAAPALGATASAIGTGVTATGQLISGSADVVQRAAGNIATQGIRRGTLTNVGQSLAAVDRFVGRVPGLINRASTFVAGEYAPEVASAAEALGESAPAQTEGALSQMWDWFKGAGEDIGESVASTFEGSTFADAAAALGKDVAEGVL